MINGLEMLKLIKLVIHLLLVVMMNKSIYGIFKVMNQICVYQDIPMLLAIYYLLIKKKVNK